MPHKYFILAFCLSCFLNFGCRKKVDENPPAIIFQSPLAGSQHAVNDFVEVQATVTDDEGLEWVKTDIVTSSNIIYGATSTNHLDGELSTSVDVGILLDNLHMPSGTYFVRIRAFDGENEHAAFREIHVAGVERELMGTYLFDELSFDQLQLSMVQDGEVQVVSTMNTDFSFAEINSYHQEIALLGDVVNGATFLLPPQLETLAQHETNNNENSSYYHDFEYSEGDKMYYATTRDNRLEIYSPGGGIFQIVQTQENKRPYAVCSDGERIFVEERSYNGEVVHLAQYFRSTGALENSTIMPFQLIDIFHTHSGIRVFGEENGEYFTAIFNPQTLLLENQYDIYFTGGQITDITHIQASSEDDEVFIFSGTGETVAQLMTDSFSGVLMVWPYSTKDVEYDEVSNQVIGLGASDVYYFSLSNSQPLQTIPVSSSVREVELLYNK